MTFAQWWGQQHPYNNIFLQWWEPQQWCEQQPQQNEVTIDGYLFNITVVEDSDKLEYMWTSS